MINSCKIAFVESGNEGIPVFLIHGNSLSSEVYKNQLSSTLLKDYRLIVPDLPGHGNSFKSTTPDADYNLPNLVKILVEFISSFKFDKYFVFGNSLGGHLLISSLPYLNGVEGIAISGTPPLASPPDLAACYLPNPATPLAFKPVLTKEEMKLLASVYCKPSSDQISTVPQMIENTDPEFRRVVGEGLMTGQNNDEVELLKQANIPITIIHGTEDSAINPEYLKQLTIDKWEGKVHFIDNAGHLSFLENAKGFNEVLGRFVASVH